MSLTISMVEFNLQLGKWSYFYILTFLGGAEVN